MSAVLMDVVARVERVARERSNANALTSADGDLSYGQLWSQALALAGHLHESGVQSGDPVALCLPRSIELVVGALGIMAAGGCYVALDPAYPDDRLKFMLADSGARVAVATADTAARLDVPRSVEPMQPVSPAPVDPRPVAVGDPAYIVYTSGSTGRPKGVLIEHRSLGNLVGWHEKTFDFTASDRSALISSPGFDAAVWEIWPCLAVGASLIIPPDCLKTDPIALRDWLLAERITTTFVPTPLCEELMALDWPATAPLRVMLTGGDVLHRRPTAGLPFRLVNNYGVSEAAVVSTSGTVAAADAAGDNADLPTLGAAISGVKLTVVDSHGQPVPPDTDGELVISGVSVGRGYVSHPVHNQARFFLNAAGDRCYRTGDLVRLRADGQLVHLGRLDEQVNIRGLRIELGEITAVLDQHPKVRASTVVAVGNNGSRRLRAFIVGAAGRPPATAELRDFLSKRLPPHMIPTDCTLLDRLPINANGKIDRKLLRESGSDIAGRGDLAPPRNDLEGILADIVAERLWLPAIGIDEDFFALGGHSMLGAQLSVRIGERFGIEVPLRSVFENPTVAAMAVEVERLLVADIEAMSDDELLQAGALMDYNATSHDEELAG
jgi:amino acid adenylation domain-containing protein